MISVQSNILAMNANRQFKVNTGKTRKSTEKLSSGYRINRAADDAAGIAISEKMRRQIRGLMQGTANAQDGMSYVQVADGAMNEVHDMLQRMNELSIQALNGTYTESDRAALNEEFDHLRTEIDRISHETMFNDQPVFEEHEDSFHQIEGNKKWNDNQMHTVPASANELTIHLSNDFDPKDYTVTVPAGIYTTQELIDEIDDALSKMSPSNPGFEFEYTEDGLCNVNFESADGSPTEIASVDGSLAYLIHDFYTGKSTVNLLGTTVFDVTEPLIITKGQNDELGFYVEGKKSVDFVSMKIPSGAYSRSEMIDFINSKLKENPNTIGVVAKEYGNSSIQITGGDYINITGLKGNMFKLETTKPVYSSVFYDNVKYGNFTSGTGTSASITASTYYNSSSTAKFYISDKNNTLRFKLNNAADYSKITLTNGEYTLSGLVSEINKQLKAEGLEDEITVSTLSSSYLKLSSTKKGAESTLEFDTSSGVYANTYADLFLNTRYLPKHESRRNALLTGNAKLSGEITLSANDSLSFNVDNDKYTISNIAGNYANIDALVNKLNACIDNLAGIKGKVKFAKGGNGLALNALTNDIQKIYFASANQNETYKKLFVGTTEAMNSTTVSQKNGNIERPQGSTQVNKINATIEVTVPADRVPITIDANSNKMTFTIHGSTKTITLGTKTYNSMNSLISEINQQLKNSNNDDLKTIEASYDNGKLKFVSIPPSTADDGVWSFSLPYSSYQYTSGTYAWKAILGTKMVPSPPSVREAGKTSMTTHGAIPEKTIINNDNKDLILNIGTGDVKISIASGTYNTREELKNAVQNAINASSLSGKVTASITSDNKLQIGADSDTLNASGSFYREVILDKITAQNPRSYTKEGTSTAGTYTDAYIIGRKDLSTEPVEIISGANDIFTFDFTHTSREDVANSYEKQMDIKIPEGVYTGTEIASLLQSKIQEKFDEEGFDDFEIKVSVGGITTGVVGSNDDTALQIVVQKKADKTPDAGEYVLDGIRGSAASFIFYKTTEKPKETYISGTKDLSGGISFTPDKNVLTLSADSTSYKYTFPEGKKYTADEYVNLLNDMFTNGDDNGDTAPLKASLENGVLRISHKVPGSHTITDIGGNARDMIFFEEKGRESRDPIIILVGADTQDVMSIPRIRLNSATLKINSITISQQKYAEKAVGRVKEAINILSTKRSVYGAMHNRLEHTFNNNNNVIENTQASESAIRDADMAYEVMEQAKNNFMQQTSQTILAQSNHMTDMVLNLLQ